MSTIAFLNVPIHGRVDPTVPVVAELVRRGHSVTYHAPPAFSAEIAATGATVFPYPESALTPSRPPVRMLDGLARAAVDLLPGVLSELRGIRPDLVVHDSACLWGALAARELGVPAASLFTTFAGNRYAPSPSRVSWKWLARPHALAGLLRSRWRLRREHDTGGLPLDFAHLRQPLNLVFTPREFQPGADTFGRSFQFVGAGLGTRPPDPAFPIERLRDPVLYASLGADYDGGGRLPRVLATALAPLGGAVVLATGTIDPAGLGPLPDNVIARRTVPQLQVLSRAALFVTHGGMNSVNEAMAAGVPMLLIPRGADQPLVARRVVELGAGLSASRREADVRRVRALARRLMYEPRFLAAADGVRVAQRETGGFVAAADALETCLPPVGHGSTERARA
ncbi:macrolide family glycosyltransferase [Nonomuraea sp. NPDC050790]|uniref:macrolide family glycosyltransferase n=1 Tax=Nonomuraea sp. NPDC050790 TaxID=3364371 RepID=UPI00379893F4